MAQDSPTVCVAIIDAQPIFRAALEQLCESVPELRVVSSVATGREGLAEIRRADPHVAIVDLNLPDIRGLAVLRALACEPATRTRILVLTGDHDGSAIYGALAAGAAGYIAKAFVSHTELSDAVLAIAAGSTVVSPELLRFMAAEIRLHAAHADVRLTQRERDILTLVAQGCSAPDIAHRLFVSQSTVKTHLRHLYEKLGVSDRAAAVAQAMKHGLVEAA